MFSNGPAMCHQWAGHLWIPWGRVASLCVRCRRVLPGWVPDPERGRAVAAPLGFRQAMGRAR